MEQISYRVKCIKCHATDEAKHIFWFDEPLMDRDGVYYSDTIIQDKVIDLLNSNNTRCGFCGTQNAWEIWDITVPKRIPEDSSIDIVPYGNYIGYEFADATFLTFAKDTVTNNYKVISKQRFDEPGLMAINCVEVLMYKRTRAWHKMMQMVISDGNIEFNPSGSIKRIESFQLSGFDRQKIVFEFNSEALVWTGSAGEKIIVSFFVLNSKTEIAEQMIIEYPLFMHQIDLSDYSY